MQFQGNCKYDKKRGWKNILLTVLIGTVALLGVLIPLKIHGETSKVLLTYQPTELPKIAAREGINEPLELFLKAPRSIRFQPTAVSFAINKDVTGPTLTFVALSGFYDIIKTYDWNPDIAYRIMWCESQGNPGAHNYSDVTKDDSWGLFQINLYGKLAKDRPAPAWLRVPENNIAYAYSMYQADGFAPWTCYRR